MRRVVEKPSSSSSSSSSQEKYSFSTSTPGHELLIKDDQLNDLNYFLRNTGPPTLPVKPSKRKAFGFGMLGKKGHEDQAQDTQSPKAGVPPVPALPPMLPVCAREERTKNGTRYVKILIPEDHDSHGQTKPSPIADENRQSKRYSANCVWTQEMLNPLGSSPVEDVIAGYASSSPSDSSPSGSPKTVVHTPRSPKPSRRLPARVPVNSHPLAGTRQDRTRARKLRDLHKSRTTTMLLDYGSEANHNEEYSTPQRRQQVLVDSKEWVRLQRLNKELARELATAAGLEENGEGFTPEYVLEVFQMVHRRSY
ncbi:hypothetical protein DM02DRAFT_615193 [Periconia macrospinosa]|uniref:Uncharacterized protein n=1 Tax=Periconia macrospinosa TaxID=97972 RepID=A0A2V1DNQ4_9PLEO|nr:hypothetical protein DM02DRAFT_615193 [Periconia macrospinosa]